MNLFKRLLMLAGGGESVPYDYPDKFSFFATSAVVEPSILEVLRPDDRLGDFTVVRASAASYTDSSGVIQIAPDNVARIDYTNGVAELLTEPQSTNLITYSEDFNEWQKSNLGTGIPPALTSGVVDSPIEGRTSTRAVFDMGGGSTSGDYSYINLNIIGGSGSTGYGSIYMKSNTGSNQEVYLRVRGSGTLISKTVTNEWQRFGDESDSLALMQVGLRGTYTSADTSDILIIGVQSEALPYATSYIPTNGSTVTRLQDVITDGGNVNVINSEGGVLFFEGSALFDDGTVRSIVMSDGTPSNKVEITYSDVSNQLLGKVIVGGVETGTLDHIVSDATESIKLALKFKVNDFSLWINGGDVSTDLSGASFGSAVLNQISLSGFYSRTAALKVYDRALTDEELENITKQDLVINPTL